MKCANPKRGVWGGPPDGGYRNTIAASKLAYAPRGKMQLASVIKRDLWEIGYKKAPPPPPKAGTPPKTKPMGFFGGGMLGGLALIGLGALLARRKRTSQL